MHVIHHVQSCLEAPCEDVYCCRRQSSGVLQVVTQISLVGLLFGTLCGDFALLSDVGTRTVHRLWLGPPPGPPSYLLGCCDSASSNEHQGRVRVEIDVEVLVSRQGRSCGDEASGA